MIRTALATIALPCAILSAAGLAAWTLAGNPLAAIALATTAGGVCIGAGAFAIAIRRDTDALRGVVGVIAGGDLATDGDAPDLGLLAPVTPDLAALAQRFQSAKEAATNDRLTHVANRPTLLAQLFQEVDRAGRYGRPLTIAFIDIDHFKVVNDTYGHGIGDLVLQAVSTIFRENLRESDFIGRYGGEEFVLILPETDIDEATSVAEKLRLLVLKRHVRISPAEEIGVSVSIGMAGGRGQALHVDQLLRDADAAMYSAKSLGRNQTYVFAEVDDDTARVPRSPISAAGRARATEVGELGRQAAEAALAAIISPLPHYRGKPSSLIAAIAVRMARKLDLPTQEVERIRVASLLHDIGKVGVPEQILEKPGPLSPDEWQSVIQHPQIGQVIINQVAAVKDAGAIILHHHERFSGHGYPHGLRGADIPLGARIVAIADAYDAMVHDRPYRTAISHDAAINELRQHANVQFDPGLVELFCGLFANEVPQPDPSLLMTPPVPISSAGRGHRRGRAVSA